MRRQEGLKIGLVSLWLTLLPFLIQAAQTGTAVKTGVPPMPTPVMPPGIAGLSPEMTYTFATLGFGGIAGWSVGYTLKKFAKMAALLLGVVFIAVQGLAYSKFLTVNWEKVQSLVPEPTVQNAWMSIMSMLTYNFPFAGAFAGGLYLGFSKG